MTREEPLPVAPPGALAGLGAYGSGWRSSLGPYGFFFTVVILLQTRALAADCLYVSSYHPGYEWNDGIERGLVRALDGKCRIDRFYMDTKRNKDPEFAKQRALAARRVIEISRPDVVIACDDNASKYLVQPYFKDAHIPFVFCGVNWSAETYGYPYTNATGMVERAPVRPLMRLVLQVQKDATRGIYLGPDVLSQHREYDLNRGIYEAAGIDLVPAFVNSWEDWKSAFLAAQEADFVIIGSNGGLDEWDARTACGFVRRHAETLLVTNMEWLIDYAMIAITKTAEEQGEWAGETALAILQGEAVDKIPVVVNRHWNIYINSDLLRVADVDLPLSVRHKALKVDTPQCLGR